MEIPVLVKAVATVLSDWLPDLLGLKSTGIASTVGGLARSVWEQLSSHDDGDLRRSAELHARKPEDERRRGVFIDALTDALTRSPTLAAHLDALLAPPQGHVELAAIERSAITRVKIDSDGNTRTKLIADSESAIDNVTIKTRS